MLEFKVKVCDWHLVSLYDFVAISLVDCCPNSRLGIGPAESDSVDGSEDHLQEDIVLVIILYEIVVTGACTFIDEAHDIKLHAVQEGNDCFVISQLSIVQQMGIFRQQQVLILHCILIGLEFKVVVKNSEGPIHLVVFYQVVAFCLEQEFLHSELLVVVFVNDEVFTYVEVLVMTLLALHDGILSDFANSIHVLLLDCSSHIVIGV